jgi:hypothetical protein
MKKLMKIFLDFCLSWCTEYAITYDTTFRTHNFSFGLITVQRNFGLLYFVKNKIMIYTSITYEMIMFARFIHETKAMHCFLQTSTYDHDGGVVRRLTQVHVAQMY